MSAPQIPGYGQFTGYSPAPGGGYSFQTANGSPFLAVGQPAEDLKSKFDAAQAARQLIGGPGAAPQGLAPLQAGQGPLITPAERAAAAGPGPTQANTLFSTKGGGQMALREGGDPNNPRDWVVHEPGHAATRGGMAARGLTSQGGYTPDEAFIQKMVDSQDRTQGAMQDERNVSLEAANQKQDYLLRQGFDLKDQAREQANEQHAQAQRLAELQTKYDEAEHDFLNTPADQEAARNSPKAKIATAIGAISAAFGAVGAGMARMPNFAAETLARQSELNLRREEAELRVKKEAKDSLLGQLKDQTGSLELAKNAYRAIQSKQAAIGWEMLGQKEQDQTKQAQMFQAAQLQYQASEKWLEAYKRGAEGEVTRTFQYQPGSAGSGARNRALTLEEAQAQANLGKTVAQTGKIADAGQAPAHLGQRAQGQIVAARNARHVVREMADALGMRPDEKGALADPSLGAVAQMQNPLSDTRQKVQGAMESYLDEVAKAQTGSVATKEAHDALKNQLDSSRTPGQLGNMFRHYDGMMRTVEENVRDVAASSGRGSDNERADQEAQQ